MSGVDPTNVGQHAACKARQVVSNRAPGRRLQTRFSDGQGVDLARCDKLFGKGSFWGQQRRCGGRRFQ